MKLNYFYYLAVLILLVIIVFRYGISSSIISSNETTGISKGRCLVWDYIDPMEHEVEWHKYVSSTLVITVKPYYSNRGRFDIYLYDKQNSLLDNIVARWGEDNIYYEEPNNVERIESSIRRDILDKTNSIKVFEYNRGCKKYYTNRDHIAENNCIVKNIPDNDSYSYDVESAVEAFCQEVVTDPSFFQYIKYYIF